MNGASSSQNQTWNATKGDIGEEDAIAAVCRQPASFWPSALAEGGAVEEWLSPGVDLGPGAYVDWHAPEATYARKLRESQRHRGLSVFRG